MPLMSVDSSLSAPAPPADKGGAASEPAPPVRIKSVAVWGLFVLAALYTIHFAKPILMPVVAAMILYVLLWPLVRLLAKIRIPVPLGALVVVAGLLGTAGTGIYFLADPATAWLAQAPQVANEIQAKIKTPIKELTRAKEQVEGMIESGKRKSTAASQDSAGPRVGLADAAIFVLGTVQQVGVTLLMITALLYLLLASGTMFQEKLVRSLPRFRHKKKAVEITNQIQKDIAAYLGTVTLINAGLGLAIGLGLYAIGLPNAVLWGTMAALLNFVPYIGFAIGTIIVFVVGLVALPTPADALLPPAIYIACNAVESNFITPILLSRRLTLNAVVVFLAVVVWGWLWGVSGALMAVPLLAVLKVIADRVDGLTGLSEFLGGRDQPET